MEIKDVEKRLEEAADTMELRPFSQRWEVIKDEIKVPRAKKGTSFRKWLPSVAAACAVILSGAIILPIALRNQPSGDFAPNGGTVAPDNGVTSTNDENAADMPETPNDGVAGGGDAADDQEGPEEGTEESMNSEDSVGDD